jgi:hypothetical protein
MTTRTIKGIFQAGILGGVIGLVPVAARAADGTWSDERPDVPTHAQAEARTGVEAQVPTVEKLDRAPTHEEAEARALGVRASAPGGACSGQCARSCPT